MSCKRLHVDELLGSPEVAARLGIELSTWETYISRGTAPEPVFKMGRTVAWTAEVIDAWERQRPGQGAGGGPKPKKKRKRSTR